jgi:hypothetical protein
MIYARARVRARARASSHLPGSFTAVGAPVPDHIQYVLVPHRLASSPP